MRAITGRERYCKLGSVFGEILMNNRVAFRGLGYGLPVVVVLLQICADSTGFAADAARPNIVLILTDDQGYGDVGIHGNEKVKTPNIDRFAREGVRMTRFYNNPVCSPTRASIMTGRDYYRTGVIHTSRGGAKMHGDEVTVAEHLANGGYKTGIFGKWHLGDNYPMRPQDQGFLETLVHTSGGIEQPPDVQNSYFDPELWRNGKRVKAQGYCTDVFFNAALTFIEANREAPFFVYLPTNAPHTPLEVSPKYSDPYKALGLDDTTAKVYGMVQNIDENLGRLLARLDELKLRENTLVIFLTDNGPQQERYTGGLRARKSFTYEGGIRVPCIVQWPVKLTGERTIDRIAAHIDLLPTLLAACGVQPLASPKIDGMSLLPLLTGQAQSWPERTLYFQCHRGLSPQRYQNCAAVTQRYKLVGSPGTFNQEKLPIASEAVLELYDLEADPGEQRNLAAENPRVLAELRRGYDAWYDSVRDARGFTPGVIHVGNPRENPVRLCMYQDATFVDGKTHGWSVEIERAGRYRVTMLRGMDNAGTIHVNWIGKAANQPTNASAKTAIFDLPAGKGVLDVSLTLAGQPPAPGDNEQRGDVTVEGPLP